MARYSARDVERLIDGYVFDDVKGEYRYNGGLIASDDDSYIQLRSRVEKSGKVDSEEMSEVLDVERAVTSLNKSHPIAGMIMWLAIGGWTPAELNRIFGGKLHKPAGHHLDKGIAWCQAWLNGEDPEPAYRGARPRELSGQK